MAKWMKHMSPRAQAICRRSYNRPLNEGETKFEVWNDTVDRVIEHQRWLWERAKGEPLDRWEEGELEELRYLMYKLQSVTSGRTLWLGGTETAMEREASQFNCSFLPQRTIHDLVDQIWLLLQGCGVGVKMKPGTLSGFSHNIPHITVIRSDATDKTGEDENTETFDCGVWTIRVGDSAEAWAKAFGKLFAGKYKAEELVIDLRPIRPAGYRLKGYGWISSGDEQLAIALEAIAEILNKKAGKLLDKMDLLDVACWMGSVLSSRRSAGIALCDYESEQWEEFLMAKRDYWKNGKMHRRQTNNTMLFWHKPTKLALRGLFQSMLDNGGSEPGFYNAALARERAPWFAGCNPCGEILLGYHSFCNLVETNLSAFNGFWSQLLDAHRLIARANYRQTCVNLRDGVLQDTWHELNEFLRLCGVGVTGIMQWEYKDDPVKWHLLRMAAIDGANSMADELDLPRPKLVTTIKPSGTLSKVMDTTEGIHAPLGRYMVNNVIFSRHDPAVAKLIQCGYRTFDHIDDPQSIVVSFPIDWGNLDVFTKTKVKRTGYDGSEAMVEVEVNLESAVDQLERYKLVMDNYVDHNCSVTISYSPEEIPEIVNWLYENWDSYVGVSWMLRNDPTKTAADLGHPYLPQEVITKVDYDQYVGQLKPFDIGDVGDMATELDDECAGGACPVR